MQRVLFIASSGGHYKQLRKLDPLIGKYHGIVITERIRTLEKEKGVRYLHQVNRKVLAFRQCGSFVPDFSCRPPGRYCNNRRTLRHSDVSYCKDV